MSWYGNFKIEYKGKHKDKFAKLCKLIVPNSQKIFNKSKQNKKEIDAGNTSSLETFGSIEFGASWYTAEADMEKVLSYLDDGDSIILTIDGETHPYTKKSEADKSKIKYDKTQLTDCDYDTHSYNYDEKESQITEQEFQALLNKTDGYKYKIDNERFSYKLVNNKRVYTQLQSITVKKLENGKVEIEKNEQKPNYSGYLSSSSFYTEDKYAELLKYNKYNLLPNYNDLQVNTPVSVQFKTEYTFKDDPEIELDKEVVTFTKKGKEIEKQNPFPDEHRRTAKWNANLDIMQSNREDPNYYERQMKYWAEMLVGDDEMLKIACEVFREMIKNEGIYVNLKDGAKNGNLTKFEQSAYDEYKALITATKNPQDLEYFLKSFLKEATVTF